MEDEKKILLDGQEVTEARLQEVRERKDVRLHQESETEFRTLHRMQD